MAEHAQVRLGNDERVLGAGDRGRHLSSSHHFGISHYRRGEQRGTPVGNLGRTRAEASADTVEQSTSTRGAAPLAPDISPSRPSTAETRSSDEPTVMNTMSLAASSAAVPTGLAPSRTSGSALAGERL